MPKAPTQEQIAYMMAHIDDNLVPNIIIATSVCGAVATGFLFLRFYARRVAGAALQMSDWLLAVGWIFFLVFDILFGVTLKFGAGRHVILVATRPDKIRMLQILNINNEVFYSLALAFIKFSLLSLYLSIFPQSSFRRLAFGIASFVALWAVSASLVSILQCLPIAYGWDPAIPNGYCVNYGALVLATNICNIITDFAILILPVPYVLKLNLSAKKKKLVLITFVMGGSACIVSIIRTTFTLKVGTTADPSWDIMPGALVSVAELMAGIIAASLPVYGSLVRRLQERRTTSTDASKYSDFQSKYKSHSTKVGRGDLSATYLSSGGITVTDQIHLTSYSRDGSYRQIGDKGDKSSLNRHGSYSSSKESTGG